MILVQSEIILDGNRTESSPNARRKATTAGSCRTEKLWRARARERGKIICGAGDDGRSGSWQIVC
jgi:hypothetical protein